jgi:hypothetical protein
MGKGSLQRIAALTAIATMAVMACGAVNVGALVGISTPTVTTDGTVPTVTAPSTTVTVPSTPVTPTTTVTTPTLTTSPKPTTQSPTGSTSTGSTPSGSRTSPTDTVKSIVKDTTDTATKTVEGVAGTVGGTSESGGSGGGGSSGSSSPGGTSATKTVGGLLSTGTSTLESGAGTGAAGGGGTAGAGATGSNNAALQALGFFGGSSGPGGGAAGGGGDGAASIFGGGSSGDGLPPVLSAAGAKQLRAALDLLDGCMPAIAPLDRQVLMMRAGGAGAAPLSRGQVASRLGVSTRQVRFSERRGLSGLRTAAAQTACAGGPGNPFSVAGIAVSPLVALTTAPGAAPLAHDAAAGGEYVPARQAQPGAGESPLARLTDGAESGPAWLVVLVTVLFSVSIAGLMRELRSSLGAKTRL